MVAAHVTQKKIFQFDVEVLEDKLCYLNNTCNYTPKILITMSRKNKYINAFASNSSLVNNMIHGSI